MSFNSPGGDQEAERTLVTDRSLDAPESNSAASSIKSSPELGRAAPKLNNYDAHRIVQQPQMDDQSSNDDDASSEGRGSPNLSGYNPGSDGSSQDGDNDINCEGEYRPIAEGSKVDFNIIAANTAIIIMVWNID